MSHQPPTLQSCQGCERELLLFWRICPFCTASPLQEQHQCEACARFVSSSWKTCPWCEQSMPVKEEPIPGETVREPTQDIDEEEAGSGSWSAPAEVWPSSDEPESQPERVTPPTVENTNVPLYKSPITSERDHVFYTESEIRTLRVKPITFLRDIASPLICLNFLRKYIYPSSGYDFKTCSGYMIQFTGSETMIQASGEKTTKRWNLERIITFFESEGYYHDGEGVVYTPPEGAFYFTQDEADQYLSVSRCM